jgi:hypothetical protein
MNYNISNYPVPSGTQEYTYIFLEYGDPDFDIAHSIPYQVKGGTITKEPFDENSNVEWQSASQLRKMKHLVLPASYAGLLSDSSTTTGSPFIYQVTLELPSDLGGEQEDATVYLGLGASSYSMHGHKRITDGRVQISGTHGKQSLDVLAEMAMHKGVSLISASMEVSDDDFYNEGQTRTGKTEFEGGNTDRPLNLPFSKEGSEQPELRNNVVFGQNGIQSVILKGKEWLSLPVALGTRVTLRMVVNCLK